jgi:hypothetical protein
MKAAGVVLHPGSWSRWTLFLLLWTNFASVLGTYYNNTLIPIINLTK